MRRVPSCVSLAACLLLNVASVFSQHASESPIVHQEIRRTNASPPVVFEANRGQADPRVRFLGRGTGYTLFLTPTETMFVEAKTAVGSGRNLRTSSEDSKTLAPAVVRMKLVGVTVGNPYLGTSG